MNDSPGPDDVTPEKTFHRIYDAMLQRDLRALDALLAPGFSLTHITGYVQPRQEWLDEIASGSMQYHFAREVSVESTVKRHHAHVVGRHVVDATIWGASGTWNLQLAMDLERADSHWMATRTVATTFREDRKRMATSASFGANAPVSRNFK